VPTLFVPQRAHAQRSAVIDLGLQGCAPTAGRAPLIMIVRDESGINELAEALRLSVETAFIVLDGGHVPRVGVTADWPGLETATASSSRRWN
jgi:hypothetical protein